MKIKAKFARAKIQPNNCAVYSKIRGEKKIKKIIKRTALNKNV